MGEERPPRTEGSPVRREGGGRGGGRRGGRGEGGDREEGEGGGGEDCGQ